MGGELARLSGFGPSHVDPRWATRLQGLAAASEKLSASHLRQLTNKHPEMRLPPRDAIGDVARQLPFWSKAADGILPARPDIFAAGLLVDVLADASDLAPDWLWSVLDLEATGLPPDLADRIGRLVYDVSTVWEETEQPLTRWLVQMVEAQNGRAEALARILEEERPPDPLLPLTLAVGERLVRRPDQSDEQLAQTLFFYATHLVRASRHEEARPIAERATEVYTRLMKVDPDRHRRHFARAVWRLGSILESLRMYRESVEAVRRAIDIYRQELPASGGEANPVLLHGLAGALNELGSGLRGLERFEEAEASYREEIAIYQALMTRPLAAARRNVHRDGLARGLHNLSNLLLTLQRPAESLEAIQNAVEIRRELTHESPWRYARYLALSLEELAGRLAAANRLSEALDALDEALPIYRRLRQANPDQFGEDLLDVLDRRARYLGAGGRHEDWLRTRASHAEESRALSSPTHPDIALDLTRYLGTKGVLDPNQTLEHGDLETCMELIEELEIAHGIAAETLLPRASILARRALMNLEDGRAAVALEDWEEAAALEARRIATGAAQTPGHVHWIHIAVALARRAAERSENALIESVVSRLVLRSWSFESEGARNAFLLSHHVLRCGDKLSEKRIWEPALSCMELGITTAESLLAADFLPNEVEQQSLWFNDLGYCLAVIVDRTGSYERLGRAEAWVRRSLELLGEDASPHARGERLDSLGYALLLRAERDRSSKTAAEGTEALREAVELLESADSNRFEIVQEHLVRALRLSSELAALPPSQDSTSSGAPANA
jgi:tetratricopeptide (TPR) repeat protein